MVRKLLGLAVVAFVVFFAATLARHLGAGLESLATGVAAFFVGLAGGGR